MTATTSAADQVMLDESFAAINLQGIAHTIMIAKSFPIATPPAIDIAQFFIVFFSMALSNVSTYRPQGIFDNPA